MTRARQQVSTSVTVTGLVPGDPPMLAFIKRLRHKGGEEKVHSQWSPVPDSEVFRRLQTEVSAGDQIEVTLVTEWDDDSITTHVADFAVQSSAAAASAATMMEAAPVVDGS